MFRTVSRSISHAMNVSCSCLVLLVFLLWTASASAAQWEWFGLVDSTPISFPPEEDGPLVPLYSEGLSTRCCQEAGLVLDASRAVEWTPSVEPGAGWAMLQERLIADGFDPDYVERIFGLPLMAYDPQPMSTKLRSLYKGTFSGTRIKDIQKLLTRLGYEPGTPDGVYGSMTARALVAFQQDMGVEADGIPDRDCLQLVTNADRQRRGLAPLPGEDPNPDPGPGVVYKDVLKASRFSEGLAYYVENRPLLRRVERRSGVPDELGVAIMTIETRVGNYLGTRPALVTLAGMAACRDAQLVHDMFADRSFTDEEWTWLEQRARDKADWAYEELKALLVYFEISGADPMEMVGSIYGAVGISQFMPSNILRFGVDGNGDGVVNLFHHQDAVPSMAHYMLGHGFEPGLQGSALRRVVYDYNHSWRYVNTVLALAERLARYDGDIAIPDMDRTVHVRTGKELLAELSHGTRIIIDGSNLDFSDVAAESLPAHGHVRWEGQGRDRYPVITGLDRIVIQSLSGTTLASATPGQPVLAFEDCGLVALDNLHLQGVSGQGGLPALMVTETDELLLRDIRISGGETGLGLFRTRRASGLNLLLEGATNGALQAVEVETLSLANVVIRQNSGRVLLSLAGVANGAIRQALIRDNGGQETDSCLALSEDGGAMAIFDSYIAYNDFKTMACPDNGVDVSGSTLRKNGF